jgi:hypothetical protein
VLALGPIDGSDSVDWRLAGSLDEMSVEPCSVVRRSLRWVYDRYELS